MYIKLQITGTMEVVTGLHIGGSSAFAAIGAVDSPVIRDTLSGSPMIPGSSLKGKMRTMLSRRRGKMTKSPDDDGIEICRVFGSKGSRNRLNFADSIIMNQDELKKMGLMSATEVKFENTINRVTAVANPRQIERVVRGAKFPLDLVYEITSAYGEEESQLLKELQEDIQLVSDGLTLLKYDYLGGHGSRGYGKVDVKDMDVKVIMGDVSDEVVKQCKEILLNT